MSEETINNLEKAIREHMEDSYEEGSVLTNWFVGFGLMRSDADVIGGISYSFDYATSMNSPESSYGIAQLTADTLKHSLVQKRVSFDNDEDD